MVLVSKRPGHYNRFIRFVLANKKDAEQVSVVSDFNGWNVSNNPMQRNRKGEWETVAYLAPGRYQYQYVVDGNQWIKDPDADAVDRNNDKTVLVIR